MQYFIKIENGIPSGEPLSEINLRQLFPELKSGYLLFQDLEGTGYEGFMLTPMPINEDPTKKVVQLSPNLRNADDLWEQRWGIVDRDDLTEEEREELSAQYAAFQKEKISFILTDAVQQHMDSKAKLYRYDDIRSAVSYATSTHPKFGPEGIAFRDWRDAVWTRCYEILAEVEAGERQIPTTEEIVAELPELIL